MMLSRLYLLGGLITHKAVWEYLKRKQRQTGVAPLPEVRNHGFVALARMVKLAIIFCLVAQTMLPDILPITSSPSMLHPLGFVVYTFGLSVAILARVQLGTQWADIEAAQILKNQNLVCAGIYRWIRHPIYTGDLMLLAGLELGLNSWLVLGVVPVALFVARRVSHEERTLAAAMPEYSNYCEQTKRFVPFLL
jgi:protein-S-isoprenylcysteine O-methyltransferase Ste14